MAHIHEHTNDECCHGNGCGCEHSHEDTDKGQFLFKLIGGGFFLIAGYILSEIAERGIVDLPKFTYLVCFMLSYLIVGFDIIKEAVEGVMHKDIFNENLLMTIASIGAFAVGEYSEGCMVVFLDFAHSKCSERICNCNKANAYVAEYRKPHCIFVKYTYRTADNN